MQIYTIAFCGSKGFVERVASSKKDHIAALADYTVFVESDLVPEIQYAHKFVVHRLREK